MLKDRDRINETITKQFKFSLFVFNTNSQKTQNKTNKKLHPGSYLMVAHKQKEKHAKA